MSFPHVTLRAFDQYSRNARVYPAVISAAPAVLLLGILVGWPKVSLKATVPYVGMLVVLYAMSDFARQRGKRIEKELYLRLGGMPSIRMLRRDDSTFDEVTKDRYRAFLAAKLGRAAPTADEEAQDQVAADGFYAAAGTWLRENTRDKRKFAILFDENVTYGFRRNLLGLKLPALVGDLVVAGICFGLLWPITLPFSLRDTFTVHVLLVLVFLLAHCGYLVVGVTWRAVGEAAESYGRQLVIAAEAFIVCSGSAEDGSTRTAIPK